MDSSVVTIDNSMKKPRISNISERSHQRVQNVAASFLHESITSSVDFPAYISWQTLSAGLSENLRSFHYHSSV